MRCDSHGRDVLHRRRRALSRAVARCVCFVLLAGTLLTVIYFPYDPTSLAAGVLTSYVHGVARVAAGALSLMDSSIQLREETLILGRFPLRIVLDCTALDVQALYLAAVLSFATGWPSKLVGALSGLLFLSFANLLRIVVLYLTGVHAPVRFDLMHEDVMTLAMLTCACLAYAVFAVRVIGARGDAQALGS